MDITIIKYGVPLLSKELHTLNFSFYIDSSPANFQRASMSVRAIEIVLKDDKLIYLSLLQNLAHFLFHILIFPFLSILEFLLLSFQ